MKVVEIIEDLEPENVVHDTSNNEALDTEVMQINDEKATDDAVAKEKDADEHWLHCDMCEYKCKTNKTMLKHLNTNHASYKNVKNMDKCLNLKTHLILT